MLIFKKLRYQNILSTGNVFTEVVLNKARSTLIVGENGAGKCLDPETTIEVEMDDATFKLFQEFLTGTI